MRHQWLVALGLAALTACERAPTSAERLYGMPARTSAPLLASVPPVFDATGGLVFVVLTAEPTAEAYVALERAGLGPPAGEPAVRVYPELRMVYGQLRAGSLRALAALRFVIAVNPEGPPHRQRAP